MTQEDQDRLVAAFWVAIDVINAHVGPFEKWPVNLKDAFADVIINHSPLLEEDIKRTLELADELGWRKAP